MIVISRWRIPDDQLDGVQPGLAEIAQLFTQAGAQSASVGRNLDEPDLWVLVTTWAQVGDYRRALSSYDFKVAIGPLMHLIVDEPSAYEFMGAQSQGNDPRPRSLS